MAAWHEEAFTMEILLLARLVMRVLSDLGIFQYPLVVISWP
jgi:hypothetical protein